MIGGVRRTEEKGFPGVGQYPKFTMVEIEAN